MKYDPEMAAWVDAWTASELQKRAAEHAELRVPASDPDPGEEFAPEPWQVSDGIDMPSYES